MVTRVYPTNSFIRFEQEELEKSIVQRFEQQVKRTSLEYNRDLFNADTIARMLSHFQALLEGIAIKPEQKISELPLLTEVERYRLLFEWNDTRRAYPTDVCIHQLFEAQVERTPNAVAIVVEDWQFTYRELNRKANQLAHYLRTLGVGPEIFVGICMERSLEMVVGLLGILKAGGVYVPLDPGYPQERLAVLLEDTQALVMLTQERLATKIPASHAMMVKLDTEWKSIIEESGENLLNATSPANLADVIYTSGSTGRPKGVMINHTALCNFFCWKQAASLIIETDHVVQKTSFSFDVSFGEILSPLVTGASLHILPPGAQHDPVFLADVIIKQSITYLDVTPSLLQTLMNKFPSERLHRLRQVICGEETLSPELHDRFLTQQDVSLINGYGPTEATIGVLYHTCSPDDKNPTVPIGRPIANTQIYLLDTFLQPVLMGVPGELYIGGVSLARGYLHAPDLTAEKFIPDPFRNQPGARLYKTGDLARYRADGHLEFLGRIDHQVNIRGFRIELGEIEATLNQHSGIDNTVVIAREDVPDQKRLVAYVVSSQKSVPTISNLRQFLQQQLPEYMIPAAFVFVKRFPLTPSGKVDRKALPEPEHTRPELEERYIPPHNPVEEELTRIWCGVLQLDRVGIHDNFFALGGHSLLATQMISRIDNTFGLGVPLRSLFETPTIAELAVTITERYLKTLDIEGAEELLRTLEN